MPTNFRRDVKTVRFFRAHPGSSSVEFFVHINDSTAFTATLGGGGVFSLHEIVAGNTLNQSGNTLRFALRSTTPNNRLIDFSDVFILCQVDI